MQVGGVPKSITHCVSAQELYEAAKAAWLSEEKHHILAGGSNTVFADDMSDWNIVLVANTGIEVVHETDETVTLRVQAGESWDGFVAWCVERGFAGIEAMIVFFFNDTATTEIYTGVNTLSLHDALPI